MGVKDLLAKFESNDKEAADTSRAPRRGSHPDVPVDLASLSCGVLGESSPDRRPAASETGTTEKCYNCGNSFTFYRWEHTCRYCCQKFCDNCTVERSGIPKFAIDGSVRLCTGCCATLDRAPCSASQGKLMASLLMSNSGACVRVCVVFFSRRGRLLKLAKHIISGLEEVGVQVSLRRMPDTLHAGEDDQFARFSEEMLSIPEATPEDILSADAVIVGAPGRQGRICAEASAYLADFAAKAECDPRLGGKLAACFTSTGGVGRGFGGHEAICASFHATFLQFGWFVVGNPPSAAMDAAPYATPMGAVMAGGAGSGDRALEPEELSLAHSLGSHVGSMTARMKYGAEMEQRKKTE